MQFLANSYAGAQSNKMQSRRGGVTFFCDFFKFGGAQRLLRAPKARAWRGERRKRERVQSPAGVNFFLHASKGNLTFFCDVFIFGDAQRLPRTRSAYCERRRREHGGASAEGASVFDHPQG